MGPLCPAPDDLSQSPGHLPGADPGHLCLLLLRLSPQVHECWAHGLIYRTHGTLRPQTHASTCREEAARPRPCIPSLPAALRLHTFLRLPAGCHQALVQTQIPGPGFRMLEFYKPTCKSGSPCQVTWRRAWALSLIFFPIFLWDATGALSPGALYSSLIEGMSFLPLRCLSLPPLSEASADPAGQAAQASLQVLPAVCLWRCDSAQLPHWAWAPAAMQQGLLLQVRREGGEGARKWRICTHRWLRSFLLSVR